MSASIRSTARMFGGLVKQFCHDSKATKVPMNFSVYLPPAALSTGADNIPVLYWLSGLTCTDENFLHKAGAQKLAAELGIALVMPDTSPRGANIEGEDESYDFGTGAGFYVDATEPQWSENYNMYTYITQELPEIVAENTPMLSSRNVGIFGHSMGGHGALVCALKNPGKYHSVSAFAPICNPTQCPWGQKAFQGYLGSDESLWKEYDATHLARNYNGPALQILVDEGSDDQFAIDGQLLSTHLKDAASPSNVPIDLELRVQSGYDHSYYFIASFVDDHLRHHAKLLSQNN